MLTVFLLITALCPAVTWQVNKLWSIGLMSPYHAVLLDSNQLVHSAPFPWPEILGMSNLFFKISVIERKNQQTIRIISRMWRSINALKYWRHLKRGEKTNKWCNFHVLNLPQNTFSLSISYTTNSMLISTRSK